MSNVALDASAILAVINGEPGAEIVAPRLRGAIVSSVNLAEVLSKAGDLKMTLESMKWVIDGLRVDIVGFDKESAYMTGSLRESTRSAGLSLGDRACLALGMLRKIPVLSAEKSWRRLGLDVEVVVIR